MSGAIMSRRSGVRAAWPVFAVLACVTVSLGGRLQAQAPDRVMATEGTVTGKVVAVSAEGVEVEERGGETRKIPIDQIRDVQFGSEPQSLRAARSMLARGRAADAVEEVAKVEAADLDGAEPLVLEELELGDWFRSLPQGLDTKLEPGGQGLSAGEAQLLAFTRVFLREPGLVILDEASSRLDPATEKLIERVVDRLLVDRTAVVIAHRLGTVNRADRILIMDDGRVAEHGERSALAGDPSSRFSGLLRTGLEEALA